jgi:hypothetical protein
VLSILVAVALFTFWNTAYAVGPFAVDGGVGDDDGIVNGVITISTSRSVTGTATPYDQTASDMRITSTGTLVLFTELPTFYFAAIDFTNLIIDEGGRIESDGQGYPSDSGPGAGDSTAMSGGGAGHGGGGGNSSSGGAGGIIYGNSALPDALGSGGGSAGSTTGGAGGGTVHLRVFGTIVLNGKISADGENGSTGPELVASGGGSGGSIFLDVRTFQGSTGWISASGGDGGSSAAFGGGGGGGGRVSIRYSADLTDSGLGGLVFVPGGLAGAGAETGGTGSIFTALKDGIFDDSFEGN